jgi:hypothetical protein
MNHSINHPEEGFRKYVLFPVSTFMGTVFSAAIIVGSTAAAIVLLSFGFLVNLVCGNGDRDLDPLTHK